MRIRKLKNNIYEVESESRKGKFYKVDLKKKTCTCPAFAFRKTCKHIAAVEEKKHGKNLNKITDFVKKQKEVDSIKLIKKFSEEEIDMLIARGELIENKGRIRILK